jgi:hypothetical protein
MPFAARPTRLNSAGLYSPSGDRQMASRPTQPDPERRRQRKRRQPNKRLVTLRSIWREWCVEIVIALLTMLAIFFLVERMNIRQTLFAWLVGLLEGLENLITGLIQGVTDLVRNTTLSDLTAYVLLLLVAGLGIWRLRQRLMTRSRFTEPRCPRCGSDLHRIRRYWRDRVANLFVPVRRYQCKNQECRWRGLRVRKSQHD